MMEGASNALKNHEAGRAAGELRAAFLLTHGFSLTVCADRRTAIETLPFL